MAAAKIKARVIKAFRDKENDLTFRGIGSELTLTRARFTALVNHEQGPFVEEMKEEKDDV